MNNAFFAWQLTHDVEQNERGHQVWPELYHIEEFTELKQLAKFACLEYLQQVYDVSLSVNDLAQLELSIWASVTNPSTDSSANEARFLRREGARRWATYFRKAHALLNEVLDPAGDVPVDSATRDASTSTPVDSQGESRTAPVDAVQRYHLIYEVINQIIGGIQLASEASGLAGGASIEDPVTERSSVPGGAQLRAAFLSASVVLARLAEASQGTPFEYENFGIQAGAAMTLSCRQKNEDTFKEDMASRIKWLEREVENGSNGPSWSTPLLDSLRRRLNGTENVDSDTDSAAVFERNWQMYSEDMPEAVWRLASPRTVGASPAQAGGSLMGQWSTIGWRWSWPDQ